MKSFFKILAIPILLGLINNLHATAADTKMICYSIQPNDYISDHAKEISKIYDGFFFTIGSWEGGPLQVLGVKGQAAQDLKWKRLAKKNLQALNRAGVSENFLTVYFGQEEAWPSPATLLSDAFTQKMADHFAAIGRAAHDLGFRGICIDVEYPYPRYSINHPIYTYDHYTIQDLEAAARKQGRACIQGVLQQFPEAVIILLPGELRTRLIAHHFQYGLLEYMAENNAAGGFHLGTEFTYSLNDPVSSLITSRYEDAGISLWMSPQMQAYWKASCTIAPGVWPLHMVETGGSNYPVRPWKEEISELKEQMSILRSVSKRYIWSYSGAPVWYVHSAALGKKYGLTKQIFKQPDIDMAEWHQVLIDKKAPFPEKLKPLLEKIHRFDRGELSAEGLCDGFGVPAHWWVLGILANPHSKPEYAASYAPMLPINLQQRFQGRDQAVRWFNYAVMDPRGIINLARTFDWRNTDSSSAHLVTFIHSPKPQQAVLQIGWDDGVIVRCNDQIVFEKATYPKRGHGQFYRDRYIFEQQIPILLQKGSNKLAVTDINSHGIWQFNLRLTDSQGLPLEGISFKSE